MNGWIHVGEMPMALCIGKLPGLDSRTASETPLAAHVQLHCATVLRAAAAVLHWAATWWQLTKRLFGTYFHIEAQPFTPGNRTSILPVNNFNELGADAERSWRQAGIHGLLSFLRAKPSTGELARFPQGHRGSVFLHFSFTARVAARNLREEK